VSDVLAQAGCIFNVTSNRWEAQDGSPCVNSIITAVPFLRITPDARSGAMGDAGLAISPDANAMHFNASKLAFAENDMGISATYTPWLQALNLQDVYLAYLSGYKKIDDLSAVGLSLRYFSLGDIAFTDENGQSLGNGRPYEMEIAAAYSRKLSENFSVAVTPKFIYSNLASGQTIGDIEITPGIAGAADISAYYNKQMGKGPTAGRLMLAAAITNLGTRISYTQSINRDYIPTNLGIGGAYEFNFDEFNSLVIAFDINKFLVPTPQRQTIADENGNLIPNPEFDVDQNDIPDYKEQSLFGAVFGSFSDAPDGFSEELQELMYSFGIEYWYDKQFAVRAGYYTEDQTKGNRRFFTVGLGLKYNIFGLNFSYLVPTTNQRNPLDNTLRFSLLFDFADSDQE